jgi:tetratricopeptide (TPR) repeat protein
MYRQALRWQPDQPDAYHLLGLLAAQLNRPDDALPLFERAIALNPVVPECCCARPSADGWRFAKRTMRP